MRGEAYRLDYRLRRRDGEYRWAIDAAAPRLGPDGDFLGYIGSVIDITERKQMEHALRQSEENFRSIFEHSNDAIFVIDPVTERILQPAECSLLVRRAAVPARVRDPS